MRLDEEQSGAISCNAWKRMKLNALTDQLGLRSAVGRTSCDHKWSGVAGQIWLHLPALEIDSSNTILVSLLLKVLGSRSRPFSQIYPTENTFARVTSRETFLTENFYPNAFTRYYFYPKEKIFVAWKPGLWHLFPGVKGIPAIICGQIVSRWYRAGKSVFMWTGSGEWRSPCDRSGAKHCTNVRSAWSHLFATAHLIA